MIGCRIYLHGPSFTCCYFPPSVGYKWVIYLHFWCMLFSWFQLVKDNVFLTFFSCKALLTSKLYGNYRIYVRMCRSKSLNNTMCNCIIFFTERVKFDSILFNSFEAFFIFVHFVVKNRNIILSCSFSPELKWKLKIRMEVGIKERRYCKNRIIFGII